MDPFVHVVGIIALCVRRGMLALECSFEKETTMVKRLSLCVVLASFVWAAMPSAWDSSALAQDTVAKAASEAKTPAAAVKKKPRGRLPNYYGQVGLSKDQRAKIYGIQKTFGDQLAALKKQIEELEKKQKEGMEAVLTAEQKTKVAELVAAAAKKRASRSKKTVAGK
jgi:hypothetical protein